MDDLFISYSRRNIDFVRQLHAKLTASALEVWVDWQDIPPTRDWWNEIKEGIEGANAFIFVISPDSLSSPTCHLEVAHAKLHSKRLIPLLFISADEKKAIAELLTRQLDHNTEEALGNRDIISLLRDNWQEISRHNWLLFEAEEQFNSSFDLLMVTLKTDYDYVKQHTHWATRSAHWDQNGRKTGFLLQGAELKEAEHWLADAIETKKEPSPSELQTMFIAKSRKHAKRRMLFRIALAFAAASSIFAGVGLSLSAPSQGPASVFSAKQFNILLTTIGETDAGGSLKRSDDGVDLTNLILGRIEESASDIEELEIGIYWLDTLVIDEQSAEELAFDHGADIVIYGHIDATTADPAFVPRFYFNPLLTGADEIAGENSFGSPIPLLLDETLSIQDNPLARNLLDEEFTPRVKALASFLYALAAFKVERFAAANQHFTNALHVPEWNDSEGKEILFLWIGTLFEKNYAYGKLEALTCPITLTSFNGEPSLDCALSAYELAVGLNDQFARAYLGLGNTYLSIGDYFAETGFINCAYLTDNATAAYTQARLRVRHADPIIVMKSYGYNGTAYLHAYELGLRYGARDCLNTDVLAAAVDSFQAALNSYETNTEEREVQQLAVRFHFQLALIYGYQNDRSNAIAAFDELIRLTELPGEYPPSREAAWRQVRWDAYVRRASLKRQIAEETEERMDWEAVLSDAQTVLDHRDSVNDIRFVSAAYFYAGLAYEALGMRQDAISAYMEALRLASPDMRHYEELWGRASEIGFETLPAH